MDEAATIAEQIADVARDPVVTAKCAAQMAQGAARLMDADFAVAVTGVGGPEPDEGRPAGTVYLAVSSGSGDEVEHHRFDGDPPDVVKQATVAALRRLLSVLDDAR
jgi:nicotinamide-nucleotide amidase